MRDWRANCAFRRLVQTRFLIAINYMTHLPDNGLFPYSYGYDPAHVAISVLIAVLASYVALNFAGRLTTTRGGWAIRAMR